MCCKLRGNFVLSSLSCHQELEDFVNVILRLKDNIYQNPKSKLYQLAMANTRDSSLRFQSLFQLVLVNSWWRKRINTTHDLNIFLSLISTSSKSCCHFCRRRHHLHSTSHSLHSMSFQAFEYHYCSRHINHLSVAVVECQTDTKI